MRDLLPVSDDVLVIALAVSVALNLVTLLVLVGQWRQTGRKLRTLRAQVNRSTSSRALNAAEWAVKNVVGTAVRVREQGVGGMLRSSIEELTGFAIEDRRAIDRVAGPDGNVAILFSDIEDSTSLNEKLGDNAWVRLLGHHDRAVHSLVAREDGHVVKSQGDGFMIAFGDPTAAVRVAVALQAETERQNNDGPRVFLFLRAPRRTKIRVRVGIHDGQVVARDGDYFGLNVAMAARVAAQAAGGQILVTDGVRDKLDEGDFVLVPAQRAELKGLPGTHQLWMVDWRTA